MKHPTGSPTNLFVRTRFAWLAYILLGYYSYMQSSVGPLMPFLSTELHMNYTVEGLHFSAFALGAVLVGLSGDRMTRLFGRRRIFWGGASGMAVGAVALVFSHHPALTLLSILVMGYTGNLLLMTIQSTLSDQYHEQRSVALTEANVVASIAASLAPLAIGGLENRVLGWRGALVLMVIVFLLTFLLERTVSLPGNPQVGETSSSPSLRSHPFPLAFWSYWVVVLLGVAIEWCIVYWGANFLALGGELSKSVAASLLSLFFLAAIVGRFIGSRLARRFPGSRLLLLALGLAVCGFPIFWLASVVPLRLIGLCITGIGVANFWPSGISLALGAVPRRPDAASARIALGSGIAALIAPFVLGWLADHVGIQKAYSVVAFLLLLMIAMLVIANRQTKRDDTNEPLVEL
jgi:MFS family permease